MVGEATNSSAPEGRKISPVPSLFQSTSILTLFESRSLPVKEKSYDVETIPVVGHAIAIVGDLFCAGGATAVSVYEIVWEGTYNTKTEPGSTQAAYIFLT